LEQEANVAKKNLDFARYAQLNKEIKELNKQLKNAEENGDMFSIYEAQKKNLKQQQEDLRKQIQAEKDKKKTDNDKIAEWEEAMKNPTVERANRIHYPTDRGFG
jgi:multidrug resistance efflux pump